MEIKRSTGRRSSSLPFIDEPGDAQDPCAGADFINRVYRVFSNREGGSPRFNNVTFARSCENVLDSSDGNWLLQSPNIWGKNPDQLAAGHSNFLAERIRKTIEKAEQAVDITTLYSAPHSGVFFDALAAALATLVAKNRPIIVRILVGQHFFAENTKALLEALVSKVPSLAGSKLRLFAGAMTTSLNLEKPVPFEKSWNHSKIVAVDGRWAIVGGHNLWDSDYLCSAPAHDVSMCLRGMAAWYAHKYCNELWAYVSKKNDHQPFPVSRVWSNNYDGPKSTFGTNALATVETNPERPQRGKTKVLSVGRLGYGLLDGGARADHADEALKWAIEDAKQSVRLSLQDLAFVYPLPPFGTFWPTATLEALADALLDGVRVQIVLSSPHSTTGSGTGYSSGKSIEEVRNKLAETAHLVGCEECGRGEMSHSEVNFMIANFLQVVPFRFTARAPRWTALGSKLCGQAQKTHEIANHAKVMIIDDRFFYIGSQNLYTSDHQEYGWIVEGQKETQELLDLYWKPLWEASTTPSDGETAADIGESGSSAEDGPPPGLADWGGISGEVPSGEPS